MAKKSGNDTWGVQPSRLDNPSMDVNNIKYRVGGYRPTLVTQNSGGSKPAKARGKHLGGK